MKTRYDLAAENAREVIEELRLAAYEAGYKDAVHDLTAKAPVEKSPQQIRDEIVAKAKADVADLKHDVEYAYPGDEYVGFIVNREKRTVVALIRNVDKKEPIAKGIAKADPFDCFNVHIGKAIALRRALGLEVPAEYYNAPAPTEVRVGDVIKYTYSSGNGPYKMLVVPKGSGTQVGVKVGVTSIAALKGKIIDDSREVAE